MTEPKPSKDRHREKGRQAELIVSTASNEGAAVIGLKGSFVGSEVIHFRKACNEAQKSGLKNWVVDLAEVDEIDGYGLASLVGLLSRSRSDGGRLVLCGINPDLRSRFEATQCDSIFVTEFTIAKAVDRLKKGQQR
jgi:anti-anti-sigma factor